MLIEAPFYHGSIRKTLIAFGRLFTNLKIERTDSDGNVVQTIKVPVSPGNRDKWLARIQEDPELSGKTQITLPRIGFELTGFQYDPSRKMQTLNQFRGEATPGDVTDFARAYSPVPYNLQFTLYVVAKSQGDALQIVEQILPFFTPGYTVTVDMFPEVGISQDIPFVLEEVSMEDTYDGSFESKRQVTYVLNFVAKTELLGPSKKDGNIILHTRIKLPNQEMLHSWDGDQATGEITGGWSDLV